MNYIDVLISKTVGWIDQMFSFVNQYSNIIVYGVLAMMVAKMMKLKINYSNK